MRWIFPAVFLAALMLSLVIFAPLQAALSWSGAGRAGLTAQTVSGTVWDGTLHEARLRGFPLGDVDAAVRIAPLMRGEVRVALSTAEARAVIVRGATRGIEDANLAIGLDRLGVDLPFPGAIRLQAATILFDEGGCARADGQIAIDVLERGFGGPPLTGALACEGELAVARLTGAAGATTADLLFTLAADGAYALESRVASDDPAIESAVALGGFARTGEAMVRKDAGRIAI